MSWITDANKRYKAQMYRETRYGYRIYTIRHSQLHDYIVERNGEKWRVADFIPGEYIAINKHGWTFRRKCWSEFIYTLDILAQLNINPQEWEQNKTK